MPTEKNHLKKYENRRQKSVEVGIGFVQGFTSAVVALIRMHGCTTEAIDLYRAGAVKPEQFDIYNIDEGDREIILLHINELKSN